VPHLLTFRDRLSFPRAGILGPGLAFASYEPCLQVSLVALLFYVNDGRPGPFLVLEGRVHVIFPFIWAPGYLQIVRLILTTPDHGVLVAERPSSQPILFLRHVFQRTHSCGPYASAPAAFLAYFLQELNGTLLESPPTDVTYLPPPHPPVLPSLSVRAERRVEGLIVDACPSLMFFRQ